MACQSVHLYSLALISKIPRCGSAVGQPGFCRLPAASPPWILPPLEFFDIKEYAALAVLRGSPTRPSNAHLYARHLHDHPPPPCDRYYAA